MRFLNQGIGISDDPIEQASNSLDEHERGHFSPVQDIIADRKFFNDEAAAAIVVTDALVDPFVAPARNDNAIKASELLRLLLTKRDTGGGGDG